MNLRHLGSTLLINTAMKALGLGGRHRRVTGNLGSISRPCLFFAAIGLCGAISAASISQAQPAPPNPQETPTGAAANLPARTKSLKDSTIAQQTVDEPARKEIEAFLTSNLPWIMTSGVKQAELEAARNNIITAAN